MKENGLSLKYKLKIHFQRILGNLAFFFYGIIVVVLIKFVFRYRILNHKEHKRFYKALMKENKKLLICSNHMTMVDSVILQYAFGDYFLYLFHFRLFPWNMPAREVFFNNLFLKVFLFLSKCIPLDRKGTPEHHELVLNQAKYIIQHNEPFIIFPEGGRSRKGRFDIENLTYGIGKILYEVPGTKVLCVYLRGDKQENVSVVPEKDTVFYLAYELIEPKTQAQKKLQAEKELALQVGLTIKKLEEEYFQNISLARNNHES